MIDRALIEKLVADNIAGTDMFIVNAEVKPDNIVSVILDSDTAVSIDNCADINRHICSSLESLGEDTFEVTVYSAGLSEPLKLQRQYIKHIGEEVEIIRKSGEKQRGILRRVDDSSIEIEYTVKKKAPGAKKKETVSLNETIGLDSVKLTRPVIKI
ncbi:MAG: ribosome assembly cofactor RimP [Prevotellaceae bacterium]|jgi:ribosome maturation factor RimP|nr:ribosome assembly cofactor RimP [Prevotellaceae bacterium]